MGRKVNDWAWKQELPYGPKFVLLALAQYASDKTGECFPGIDKIAADCGYGEKAVREHRAALVERGVIEVRRRSNNGRRTSDLLVIVGYLQAVDPTARRSEPSGRSERAKRSIRTSQAVDSTARSNKGTSQRNRSATTTARARPAVPEVEGKEVTETEWDIAEVAIAEFNERCGAEHRLLHRDGSATQNLELIVGRIRDDPHLTPEQHRQIVGRCFDNPNWPGDAGSVAVIYKVERWAGAKANTGKPKEVKPEKHSYERDLDDPRRARPAW